MVGLITGLVSVIDSSTHSPPSPLDSSRDQSDVSSDVSSSLVEDVHYQRKMGDSELSYYLPSRANGVNDMSVSPSLHVSRSSNSVQQVFASRIHCFTTARHPFSTGYDMGHPSFKAPPSRM
jgi:hypothetical protein